MSTHSVRAGGLEPGAVFAGRYEVVDLLGEGTFGAVYSALDHARSGELVALKLLAPTPAAARMESYKVSARRFQIEAQTMSALGGSRIPTLVDTGTDEAGMLYMALEYVDGRSLDQLVSRWRRLDFPVIARIAEHLLEALGDIHALGMVHRDIKPQNIMVKRETGDALLIDFGIASDYRVAQTPYSEDLTRDGVAVGTLPYIAPETLLGSPATPASDLFSLGLVLAELLAAKSSFQGMDDRSKALSLLGNEPIRLGYRSDAPVWLVQLCDALLLKDPSRRPSNARQLLERIQQVTAVPGDDEATGEFYTSDLSRGLDGDRHRTNLVDLDEI